ncbi:MAG: hypothetical protein UT33_C0017G0004 [Candidatus Peregrinibacteria bacterium GW2011_GWC2_39_14]|nr:MAG: hypothetical protein US92_C0007G0049 [Candidatus Peregrinibacteria bacterium GW2011_GWA2_38_36]KKR04733.1 MAG: hypothetical protein UT33_C0017G0004 [Candidatus Peregrinibacteria bacterium GW2011_GWC2_39_14]
MANAPQHKGSSPEQQKLRLSPSEAASRTRGDVVGDSRQELSKLVEQMDSGEKLENDLKPDDTRCHEWISGIEDVNSGKKESTLREIEKYLPNSPGRRVLLSGLRASKSSEQYKEAVKALGKIVENIDKRAQHFEESKTQLEAVKEDRALGGLGGIADNVMNNFKRGSGLEKVASIAAIGFLGYFMVQWWKKPSGKAILGTAGGLLAVNLLTRLATGKSALEHLGLFQSKEALSPEIRRLAEKSKIADSPQKLKALAKMGDMDMATAYKYYNEVRPGSSIEPEKFGIFDGSISKTETWTIIHEMVERAGGDQKFKEKFINSKGEWTVFSAAMVLFEKEGKEQILASDPASKNKVKNDFRDIFKGAELNPEMPSENKMDLFVMGYPIEYSYAELGKKDGENPEYTFIVQPSGKRVKIALKDDARTRSDKITQLKSYISDAIKSSLPSELRNCSLEYINNEWVMRDVTIAGTRTTLKFEFDQERTEPPYKVRILGAGGGVVREYLTSGGDASISIDELKRSQLAENIKSHLPVFNGLNVQILSTTPNPSDTSWDYVKGTVEGLEFGMAVKGNDYVLYRPLSILHSDKFIEAKAKQAKETLQNSASNLSLRIDDVEERLLRITAIYKGASGSVRENLWKASVQAKHEEIVKAYAIKLRDAATPADAETIWQATVTRSKIEMDTMYQGLNKDVLDEKKYGDADFKAALSQLDTIGYNSPELKTMMLRLFEKVREFDYEGLDKSDIGKLATQIYGAVREGINPYTAELATEATLTPHQQAYVKYLEGAVTAKLGDIKLKSTGWLKKTVDAENLPLGAREWNIKHFAVWSAENPTAVV